jgi:tRNA (guanine37-N1)-methyltransferase
MNISVLTVFPELYQPFLQTSLVHRAQQKGLVHIDVASFFSLVPPKERIDAPTFGPGAGMLIKPMVVAAGVAMQEQKYGSAFKIFFSPQGEKLDQCSLARLTQKISERGHALLIAGRYEGMDARVEQEYADAVVSIGDFVLMGGDLPAMMLLEGMLRFIPGVVGKEESVREDSFTGPFLDYPEYTEPLEWHAKKVPDIVRSGNHGAIAQWRQEQAAQKTVAEHFTWMRTQPMSEMQKKLAAQYVPSHYTALMHADVLVGSEKKPGVTSVTSIDIHDIARSSATYGIKQFFIVTPLIDQQRIVQTLLNFWQKGIGVDYNPSRHEAVKSVEIQNSLDTVIDAITQKEGVAPLLVATSAQRHTHDRSISFWDQSLVWQHKRPVLFLFGTGQGLTQDVVQRCDYLLIPVDGLSGFNHLSVRSAVAIVLDRWLGLQEKIYR